LVRIVLWKFGKLLKGNDGMKFNALDRWWPDTGRKAPEGAQLKIVDFRHKWIDLAYLSNRPAPHDGWIYLSTLPNKPLDNTKNNGIVTV
jgi:hypothetical protein